MPRTPMTRPSDQRSIAVTTEQHGPITRINLSCIHAGNPIPASTNVFRIGDILIDAGFAYAVDELIEALRPDPPRRVVLTHHHEDHIAALSAIQQHFGEIPVVAPAPLVELIRGFGPISKYRDYFWGQADPFPAVEAYHAGDIFETSELVVASIETPGHCPHHCGFAIRDGNDVYVLSGDLYYRRKPLSIWHESSAPDAITSCTTLAELAPEIILLPNHLNPDPHGSTTLTRQVEWIKRESERVHVASEQLGTRDCGIIAEHLYGPPDAFERLTQGEITKASFVRSVLDPVKTLPAEPINYP